ncbi:MAG TPA: diacylglycerol kinase family protein [Gemmatimonadaceae bacterium]
MNIASGSAEAAREALEGAGTFDVHLVEPTQIASTVKQVVREGAPRVLVAGGDGTIATAAAALVDTPAELAVLPGGTLNHFARALGISTVAAEALLLASQPVCRGVDVGMVNGHIFLNTSSVGAYVRFVKVREALEPRFGYRIASAIAAFRLLFTLRLAAVELDVGGERRIYRTPLVFIGVGERELQLPQLGNRVANGKRGLHVMVVRGRSRARLLALALAAVARGVKAASHMPQFDSFIVDHCTITVNKPRTVIAVDGELVTLEMPLRYELRRDALTVVCPPADSAVADQSKAILR